MSSATLSRARRGVTTLALTAVVASLAVLPAAAAPGEVTAEIKRNTLTVSGTSTADQITLALAAVNDQVVEVRVGDVGAPDFSFDRGDFDSISVDAKGGPDFVSVNFTVTEPTRVDGGRGNDTLIGGAGAEVFEGGNGTDSVDGNAGADTAFLGGGDDSFTWDPGDGSDVIEGQDGTDTLVFNGSGAAETFTLSANGPRSRFFRNVGNITMDSDDIEAVQLQALGGADRIEVNDLTGTDVTRFVSDLAVPGGDALKDLLVINGTPNDDTVAINDLGGALEVAAFGASIQLLNSEAAFDELEINGFDGDDRATAGLFVPALRLISFTGGAGGDSFTGSNGNDFLDGGPGFDVLFGLDGDDVLIGGEDGDILFAGPGDDELFGGPGEDILDCGGGNDTFDAGGDPGDTVINCT